MPIDMFFVESPIPSLDEKAYESGDAKIVPDQANQMPILLSEMGASNEKSERREAIGGKTGGLRTEH